MTDPNWKNQTIWTGDNLPIMRGMNSGTVDLIYLDPPFNSNQNYAAPIGSKAAGAAFKDTWTLDDVDRLWILLLRDSDPVLYHVIEGARLVHGRGMASYLSMMAQRLREMQRLLKPTGSLYLHCDPTASHYLKMLLDAVFGLQRFINEIVWQRTYSHNMASVGFARQNDILFLYSKSSTFTFNPVYVPYGPAQMKRYKPDPEGRLYKAENLTFSTVNPSRQFEWRGSRPPAHRSWGASEDQLEEWWAAGRIITKRDGTPRLDGLKVYLDEMKGNPCGSNWSDIPRIPNTSAERLGYPTQKPLALLDRIIKASSNEGDVVFDPFCGCATTLVSAERQGRQWVGIDLSERAAELVQVRVTKEISLLRDFHPIHRTDQPHRTDLGKLPHPSAHKDSLYGKQSGQCGGCTVMFPKRNLTIDHIVLDSQVAQTTWTTCGCSVGRVIPQRGRRPRPSSSESVCIGTRRNHGFSDLQPSKQLCPRSGRGR